MEAENAKTAKGLTVAERRERLAALVASGEVSAEMAKLIDFREPPESVRQHAKVLAAKLKAREAGSDRAIA